jgi:hypothetical protein
MTGAGWTAAPARAADPLPAQVWADLASTNHETAARAFTALQNAGPEQALGLLRQHVKPVAADAERIKTLFEELDSPQFTTRLRATEELEYLGPIIQPQLEKLLASGPPLEVRRRVELLLSRFQPVAVSVAQHELMIQLVEQGQGQIPKPRRPKEVVDRGFRAVEVLPDPPNGTPRIRNIESPNGLLLRSQVEVEEVAVAINRPARVRGYAQMMLPPPSPLWLRAERAVLLLEKIGTKEARQMLETIAAGEVSALPTQTARAALERLRARPMP